MLHLYEVFKKASYAKCTVCLLFFIFLTFFARPTVILGQVPPAIYPRTTGYVGAISPLVTFSKAGTTTNFKSHYVAGLATGINIWKSAKIGFSFEVVPFIRVEEGMSKVNNFLFHPGILVALVDIPVKLTPVPVMVPPLKVLVF